MANGKTKVKKLKRSYSTNKQQRAIAIIKKNIKSGKIESNKSILIKAGYEPAYVEENSTKIIKTKSFQELLDKYIPEKDLTKKHKELLKASTVLSDYDFDSKLTDAEIKHIIERVPGCKYIRTNRTSMGDKHYVTAYFYKPDNATQLKSLELGYKVRKKMTNDPEEGGGYSDEIKAVIVHIRKVLPQATQ